MRFAVWESRFPTHVMIFAGNELAGLAPVPGEISELRLAVRAIPSDPPVRISLSGNEAEIDPSASQAAAAFLMVRSILR